MKVDLFGQGEIAHHFTVNQFDSPGVEDLTQVGIARPLPAHGVAGIGQHAVGFSMGIHEDYGAATAQHELIDGIEGRGAQPLGMHDHEHVHVFGNLRDGLVQDLDFHDLPDAVHDHPGRPSARGLRKRHLRAAVQGQGAQQAHDFLFGVGQAVDELGEIVFEKFLTALLKERNKFPVVRGIGAHESEIELRVALVDRNAAQAVSDGAIFLFRKGLGVDDVQDQVPAGGLFILLQEFQHPVGITPNAGQFHRQLLRQVKPQGHRLVEPLQNVSAALGQGIEALFREIDTGRPERHVTQDVHREKQDHRNGQSASCEKPGVHGSFIPLSSIPASAPWQITRSR